jgi:hypothetical protein
MQRPDAGASARVNLFWGYVVTAACCRASWEGFVHPWPFDQLTGTKVVVSGLALRTALESDPHHCDCGAPVAWHPLAPTAPTIRSSAFIFA